MFDKIIDYCSSRLNYNKRYMKWNLINHPLDNQDKRLYFVIILMILPAIEMAICIHIIKDIYLAIVVFHTTIILGPIIYLFINSKFTTSQPSTLSHDTRNENFNQIITKFKKTNLDSGINNNGKNKNNKNNGDILIGNHQYKKNKNIIAIYDDDDEDYNSTDQDHLLPIYSSQHLNEPAMSLPVKIFRSLFSIPQFLIGLFLLIIGLSFGLLFYYLFAGFIPNVVSKLTFYGMENYSFDAEYLFYIYFSVVNPIIEEWFWRMFLINTFGSSKFHRIIITACYSLYHFVVLTVFYNFAVSLLFTFVVFLGGLLFVYITKYVGPLASILSHTAADIIIVFVISNMTLNWLPFLRYSYGNDINKILN